MSRPDVSREAFPAQGEPPAREVLADGPSGVAPPTLPSCLRTSWRSTRGLPAATHTRRRGTGYTVAGPDLGARWQNRPVSRGPLWRRPRALPRGPLQRAAVALLTHKARARDPVDDDGHSLSCKYSSQVGRLLPPLRPPHPSCRPGSPSPADTGGIFSAQWGLKIDRPARCLGRCLQTPPASRQHAQGGVSVPARGPWPGLGGRDVLRGCPRDVDRPL